jgi:hypothetical protein
VQDFKSSGSFISLDPFTLDAVISAVYVKVAATVEVALTGLNGGESLLDAVFVATAKRGGAFDDDVRAGADGALFFTTSELGGLTTCSVAMEDVPGLSRIGLSGRWAVRVGLSRVGAMPLRPLFAKALSPLPPSPRSAFSELDQGALPALMGLRGNDSVCHLRPSGDESAEVVCTRVFIDSMEAKTTRISQSCFMSLIHKKLKKQTVTNIPHKLNK